MKLAEFAQWVLTSSCFDGCDLDGGDIQNMAVKFGLIVETQYDPEEHGEDTICDIAPGDPWYVFSDEMQAALTSPLGKDE